MIPFLMSASFFVLVLVAFWRLMVIAEDGTLYEEEWTGSFLLLTALTSSAGCVLCFFFGLLVWVGGVS